MIFLIILGFSFHIEGKSLVYLLVFLKLISISISLEEKLPQI